MDGLWGVRCSVVSGMLMKLAGGNVIVSIPSVAGETYQLQYGSSLTLSN